jgi:hypothetical protein
MPDLQRRPAGLAMDMMGEARTLLNTALAAGLRSAGVTYTLPPIGGKLVTFDDVEMHMRDHMMSTTSAAAAVATGVPQTGNNESSMSDAARVAAAESVILAGVR